MDHLNHNNNYGGDKDDTFDYIKLIYSKYQQQAREREMKRKKEQQEIKEKQDLEIQGGKGERKG